MMLCLSKLPRACHAASSVKAGMNLLKRASGRGPHATNNFYIMVCTCSMCVPGVRDHQHPAGVAARRDGRTSLLQLGLPPARVAPRVLSL